MVWLTSSLILAIVCVGLARTTCPCPNKRIHNQEKFCNAHYIIIARVLTDPTSDSTGRNRVMRVQVIKQIYQQCINHEDVKSMFATWLPLLWEQGPSGLIFGKERLIYSPMACTIDVSVGKYYFFTGEIMGGKLRLYECNWYNEWSAIDSCQMQHVTNDAYRNNCGFCRILETRCPYPGTCDYDVPSDVCEFNASTQSHLKNAVCAWNGSECQWRSYCLAKK